MGELHVLEMGCEERRKWKEHLCQNFDSRKLCFFKTIPRKVAFKLKDLKDLKDEQVTLKGPSGNTWSVKLRSSHGEVFFAEGWKEFAEDHRREEGDFLVFRYAGNSCFRVDMSMCEKEHAYFAGRGPGAAAATALVWNVVELHLPSS